MSERECDYCGGQVRHTHGCYADEGNCDHPDEHKESDGGASGRERPVGSETEGDGTTPASPPPGAASAPQLADRVRDAFLLEDIDAPLAALVARVEQAERERDEARKNADGMARAPYGEFDKMRCERDEAVARAERAEQALRRIQSWDCLNPPRPELCADHPWLRRLVDDALASAPQETEQ